MKTMLRILLLTALTAALLLTACSALAAAKGMEISFTEATVLREGQNAKLLKTKLNTVQNGTVTFSLTDPVRKTVVYTETKTGLKAGQEVSWSVPYYKGDMTAKKPVLGLRASFVLDGKTYTYDIYYNYEAKDNTVTVEKGTWYPKNTACSFGPAFRDDNMRPNLTGKWYTFTPIDLTIQGRQTFEYVASNKYVIGEVYVDVAGDSVTVTYYNFYAKYDGKTETLTEYLTFFPDLKSVTNVEPETMNVPNYAFGQPISIEKDLNGDTNVLLFIRNTVTYCDYPTPTAKLTRYWPNLPERKALRQQMIDMMDK